jgi:hypothetical protein
METVEWFSCADAPKADFPVLCDKGALVGLDAIETTEEIAQSMYKPRWLLGLLKQMEERGCDPLVCVRVAKCLFAIYCRAADRDSLAELAQSVDIPLPSAAVQAGAKQIKEAMENYALALDISAHIYRDAALERDY